MYLSHRSILFLVFCMKINSAVTLILCAVLIASCSLSNRESVPDKKTQKHIYRDLDSIKKSGVLRAMTTYSATSYFLYRGATMGFEYEMLKRFADYLGVELEITVSHNMDSMLYKLNSGAVDLVAHGLTITSQRKETVKFTDYLYLVHQVLVQRKPENWRQMSWSALEASLIQDPIQLIGDTISVRRNSSYFSRLKHLSDEIGGEININPLPGNLSTDEIIKMVVDKEIEYTVADNNIAAINASYYPSLDVSVPLSFSQRVGWAVRPGSTKLLEAANAWIEELKETSDYYAIYNKYYKNERRFSRRIESEFFSLNNNRISPYDKIIKQCAKRLGWDWRLLASLIYQESKFKPLASAWTEASGLMQIMPETAIELGITDLSNPRANLEGGTRYLMEMESNFENVPDSIQRIKFAMASFNCGVGHVFDAQRLAAKRGLDSLVWDNNVELMIKALSYPKNYNDEVVYYGYVRGSEPYMYVRQIFERYGHYQQFISESSKIDGKESANG